MPPPKGRGGAQSENAQELPKPAVASQAYDPDYYRRRCAGSTRWTHSEGRERDPLYDGCLDRAGLRQDDEVLDVGTGRAELLVAAIERGARRAVGVEYADVAVDLARTTLAHADLGARAEVLKADARALPVADASFDLVTMLDVVEHLTPVELAAALSEASRALRPGGRIFIHTFPTRTLYNFTYRLQRASRPSRWRAWPADPRSADERTMHVGEQTLRSLRRALRKGGFRDVTVIPGLWIHTGFIPDERARRLYERLSRVPRLRRLVVADLWGSARRP